jgi:hypothetical protein
MSGRRTKAGKGDEKEAVLAKIQPQLGAMPLTCRMSVILGGRDSVATPHSANTALMAGTL